MVDAETQTEFAAIAAPTGDEEARLRWLEQRLRDAPGGRARDAAGNLVWRFSEGARAATCAGSSPPPPPWPSRAIAWTASSSTTSAPSGRGFR
jgi:hypothetical protein